MGCKDDEVITQDKKAGEKTTEKRTEIIKQKTTQKASQKTTQNKKETTTLPKEEKRIKIAIDAGHQKKQMSEQEAIGPGADKTKPMVSSGTEGVVTKRTEYQVNLEVSLKLRVN